MLVADLGTFWPKLKTESIITKGVALDVQWQRVQSDEQPLLNYSNPLFFNLLSQVVVVKVANDISQ